MSLKAKAVNSAVSTGTGQVFKFAIRTASLAVLARYLGPEEYGVVALTVGITSILRVFQDAGLSMATVQAPTISQLASSSMYWLNVILGAAVFAVICALTPLVVALYDRPELAYLFPCFGLAAFLSSFRAQRIALLQRDMQFRLLAAADVASNGIGVAIGIAIAMAGGGVWALVAIELAQTLVYNVVVAWFHRWKPDFRYSHCAVKPFLRFGTSIMASNTIAHCSKGLDAVIIGSFLGTSALGIYNRAQNILNGPLRQFITPLATVARAAVFRTTKHQHRFADGVVAILGLISLGSALIVLTSLSLAQPIVLALLGPRWTQCIPVFMILMPFAFVEPCSVFLHNVLVSKGEASALLKWKVFSLVVIVTGLFAGLPWGLLGVSLAYVLFGVFVRFPLLFCYTSRKTGIPLGQLLGSILPTLGACAAASAVAVSRHLAHPQPTWSQSALTLGSALLTFATITMLFPASRRPVWFVLDSLRDRLPRLRRARGAGQVTPGASAPGPASVLPNLP